MPTQQMMVSRSEQLAFDFDIAPVWEPIGKLYGLTVASLLTDMRCRDCGAKITGMNQGGSSAMGIYAICDGCAPIDDCRAARTPDHHVSHWGDTHPAGDHDQLVAEREARRAKYLKRRAS